MPQKFTEPNVRLAWSEGRDKRRTLSKRRRYLKGDHAILEKGGSRRDGEAYNRLVVNWVSDIVRRHAGFLLGKGVSLSIPDDADNKESQEQALANYENLDKEFSFDAMNARQYTDALALGYRVEVHGAVFSDDKLNDVRPVINDYGPENWSFAEDDEGALVMAINEVRLPKASVYKGQFLDDDLLLWWVYTDEDVAIYKASEAGQLNTFLSRFIAMPDADKAVTSLQVVEGPAPHHYGRVPVFRWSSSSDFAPLIDDAFLTLQDAYNTLASGHIDDFETDIEALLVLTGFDPDAAFEKRHGSNLTVIEEMRQHKTITMPDKESSAAFLTRSLDVGKVTFSERWLREAIHVMGRAPDLQEVTGSTGATSGIALRLRFQRMVEFASETSKYIERSIKERVELLNAFWKKHGDPTLDDFDIQFSLTLPANEKEATELAMLLEEKLSPTDLLRLVPVIEDPAKAVANREQYEAETAPDSDSAPAPQAGTGGESESESGNEEDLDAEQVEEATKLSNLPDTETLIQKTAEKIEPQIEAALVREGAPAPSKKQVEDVLKRILAILNGGQRG